MFRIISDTGLDRTMISPKRNNEAFHQLHGTINNSLLSLVNMRDNILDSREMLKSNMSYL